MKISIFPIILICKSVFLLNYSASAQSYLWAKSAGASDIAVGNSVATDAIGNVIVTGSFRGSSITFGTVTLINTNAGLDDIFIVKYNNQGNVLWAKGVGGTDDENPKSVATDSNGNIIVTGYFESQTAAFGAVTLTNSGMVGTTDFFLVKYDSSGNVVWAIGEGGNSTDFGASVCSDGNGNIIAAGAFKGASIAFGGTVLTNTSVGSTDVFIVKYDPNGNVLWAKSGGGVNDDASASVTTDLGGNVIVTGAFFSPSITFGTLALTNTGSAQSEDIFIVKYDSNGSSLWAKSIGETYRDISASIITDSGSNIIVTGIFFSPSINFGATTLINAGSFPTCDVFIAKFDSTGNPIWAQSAGGSGNDYGSGVITDGNGNIILIGHFYSSNIIFGSYNITNTNTGTSDIFIVKSNSVGNILWANNAGGAHNDLVRSVNADLSGDIVVTGGFISSTIVFGTTTLTNSSGFGNIFTVKLSGVTNITELNQQTPIHIFPNPTTGKFQVTTIRGYKKQIEIYSMPGEKVFSQIISSQNETFNLQLAPGMYFVKVIDGDKVSAQKLVIQ